MPRVSLLRYRFILAAIKSVKTKKLLLVINIAIFISIFALSASILSILFENKIDKIETKLIREDLKHVVYNNWLHKTPNQIKNNEKILMDLFKEENYQSIVRSLVDQGEELPEDVVDYSLITDREQFYSPYFTIMKRVRFNLDAMMQSVTDAILVSSSEEDLHEIIKYRQVYNNLFTEYENLMNKRYRFEAGFSDLSELSSKEKFIFYKKFRDFRPEMELILKKQNDFFLNFNSFYFSKKREEYLKNVLDYRDKIKLLSKKESDLILLAFTIQIIIFIISQFFEFTLEFNRKKVKNK